MQDAKGSGLLDRRPTFTYLQKGRPASQIVAESPFAPGRYLVCRGALGPDDSGTKCRQHGCDEPPAQANFGFCAPAHRVNCVSFVQRAAIARIVNGVKVCEYCANTRMVESRSKLGARKSSGRLHAY